MNFKLISILVLSFILVGCASTQKEYITTVQMQAIRTPSQLLLPCDITKPITQSEYMAKTLSGREEALTILAISLYEDLKVCNNQIAQIKAFEERQSKIIEGVKDKQ